MSESPKPTTDWERIEADYRAGILSLREIANQHGITEGAIRKRAKRDQWTRNLAAKIQAKAEELVRKEAVRVPSTQLTPATEKQVVEANAQAVYEVRIAHRTDIRRAKTLSIALLAELEAQTVNPELMARLGELMFKPDEKGVDKLADAYAKAISLPGRITSMKALAETLKNLVLMERESWGLDKTPEGPQDNPLAQILALVQQSGSPIKLKP